MKERIFLLFLGVLISPIIYGQSATPEQSETWYTADKLPSFPTGMSGFYEYIQQDFKCSASKAKIKGKVLIQFVVDSTGYIRKGSIKPLKDISPLCKEKLIEVLEKSPKWTPGRVTKLNKDVAVNMMLPIDFK